MEEPPRRRGRGWRRTAPPAPARARGRSRCASAASLGFTLPRLRRSWLFHALATSTSPIAPPLQPVHRLLARSCVLRDCVPTWMTTLFALRGLDHQPALADVVRTRLLDVDVLAGVGGEDRGRGVPVVRRGDPDGVDAPCRRAPARMSFVGLRLCARRRRRSWRRRRAGSRPRRRRG